MKFRKRYQSACLSNPLVVSISQVISIDTSVESIQTGDSSGSLDPSQFMGKPGDPIHIYKSFDLLNKPYDPTLNDYYIEKSKQRLNGNTDKTTN